MKCEHCQLQLLPYLYDLLEEQDRAVTAEHLAACPACQEALRVAKEQQGLLAEAVKERRTDVVFATPTHDTAVKAVVAAPTLVLPLDTDEPFQPKRRTVFLLNRWSIAASIMLFVFSAGGVLCWFGWREQASILAGTQDRLTQAQIDMAQTQNVVEIKKRENQVQIRAIQHQIDQLFHDWKNAETTTRKVIEDKRVSLTIIGPQNAIAGANNYYQVQVASKSNPLMNNVVPPANVKNLGSSQPQLQVRAVDKRSQEILYEQNVRWQGAQGQGNFGLPPNLPISPGQQIELQFRTNTDDGNPVLLSDNLDLVFPEYVTHLSTDRSLYRPGETLRYRSLTLERFSLKPAQQPLHLRYRIVDPRGNEIFKTDAANQVVVGNTKEPLKGPKNEALFGLGAGDFVLPANLPDGQYSLLASEVNERFHEEKRNFLVHQGQAPHFSKDVKFHRSSYSAGDQVKMTVRVALLQGVGGMNVKGGMPLVVVADPKVDGIALPTMSMQTDNDGRADFEFTLPQQILKGDGRVTIVCNDGGVHETIQRAIPITGRDLQVEFYPEGGDLIAGVPNRVYFQARTLANRPADIEGRIVDDRGLEVARVQTVVDEQEPGIDQGLGSFTFTPQPKKRYSLRIDAPIGIERPIALPSVKERGVVLNIAQGVVKDEIKVTLNNVKDRRELLVGAYCRGRMLGHQEITIDADQQATVTLKPATKVGGVYRITVFEKQRVANEVQYRPLAERLIYRKSAERVDVAVECDRPSYQPAESVRLKLRAHNEKMKDVPAVALLAVVDQRVLRMVDDKKARSMPTHFFLTTELRNPEDLEHADLFLSDDPRAARSLDLLLGSQGWRRFAEQDPSLFLRRQQQPKQPIFLANSAQVPQFLEVEQKQIDQLDQKFVTAAIDLQKRLAEREREADAPREMAQEINQKHIVVEQFRQEVASGEQNMRRTRAFLWQFVLGGMLLTLFFIGFYLISVGLRRLSDGESPRLWFMLGFGLFTFLFLASVIGTFALLGEDLMDVDDFRFGRALMAAPAPAVIPDINRAPAPEVLAPILPEEERTADEPASAPKIQPNSGPGGGAPQQIGINFFGNADVQNFANNNFDNQMAQRLANGGFAAQDERRLRQEGQYQAILLKHVGRRVQLPAANDPSIVREYAHLRQARKDDGRRDFAETVYWHPVLVMPDGRAEVKFDLNDAVTNYRVLVLSHTADGRLGANQAQIAATLPYRIEPTVPSEVASGDEITLPIAVANRLAQPASLTLSARGKGLQITDPQGERGLNLAGNQRKRELFSVKPTIVDGTAYLRVASKTAGYGEAIERSFKVVQDGFPIHGAVGGVLASKFEHEIVLPEQWQPGSLKLQAHFYPSPLAELQSALDAMLREPTACFEQSASSNSPNAMILQWMKQNNQANPRAETQARQLLQTAYPKLTSFECSNPAPPSAKGGGFEWFHQTAPPDAALTAYALLQFREMAKFYRVDPAMLQRTEQFLLERRDGKGGFHRNPSSLAPTPEAAANAYIVWALTESGVKDNLDLELAALRDQAKISKDPYFLALAGLSQLNRKKLDDGLAILRALRDRQKTSGEVPGAQASITGSQGRDLLIETTALAVLGWLKANRPAEFQPNINNGMQWLNQQRRDGSFGGTQATLLALKAIVAYSQRNPRVLQGGNLALQIRGAQPRSEPQQQVFNQGQQFAAGPAGAPAPPGMVMMTSYGSSASFSIRSHDVVTLNSADIQALHPGKNLIDLSVSGANQIPFALTWSYRTTKPANDPKAPVKLTTKLSKIEAKEGEAVKLHALIENTTGTGQGMTIAILGLPAGLALPDGFAQLKSLTQAPGKANGMSAWELRGRELVLYWRDLAPNAKIALDLDLTCRIPGAYHGPASRAYLYYDADRKFWAEPLGMRVFAVE